MLTESIVVDAVCLHLESEGWLVTQKLRSTQRGDDIIAVRRDTELHIEAKGEGSERDGSGRHGDVFYKGQVRSHVAVAFYRAAKMRSKKVRAGMAFPDNEHHREMVSAIESAIRDLGIVVFWVDRRKRVRSSG